MNWPDNPTVLTLDEDSSPQIDTDIDPYGELEEQPDDDANKTYNNHVIDAKLNGVNPAVSNTAKVTEKEVESLFKGFLSIQKFMAAVMKTKTSGSHDSDPMQYTRRAISKSKTTKILTFSAFYFFCKSEKVQDFGFTFSAVLASSLVADSMPGSIANMKGSRSTSPVMMVSVPSSEQIADAITSMKEVMAADVKERQEERKAWKEECEECNNCQKHATVLNEYETLTQILQGTMDKTMKQRLSLKLNDLANALSLPTIE